MEISSLIPKEPSWLQTHTILLGKSGSHANGTATESSDFDYKGICIPPVEYFLELNSFEGYDKTGGKNFKNKAGDIDITILHINKFVRDAMAGLPNNLELLCLDDEDYLYIDEFGAELISMRKHFFSKGMLKKFADSQVQKMKNLNPNSGGRIDLIEKYGYDTKAFMHTVRLLQMSIEILLTGKMKTKRDNAEFLKEIRKGIYTLDEAVAFIEELEKQLKMAYRKSTLPEQPDFDYINHWLVDFNLRYIKHLKMAS